MLIPQWITSHGSFLYDLFYALPFYLVTMGMLIVGIRKGYPVIPLAIILGMGRMGFLFGTWIGGGALSGQGTGRSTLFSLLFGVLFVVPTIRYLRFRHPILELYALFIPLALAIQRLGCLSIGCCFGNPTHSIFGIQYDIHSLLGRIQVAEARIATDAVHTLSVHPVPLYLLIGYLLTQGILLWIQPRIKFTGGLASLSLALLMLNRFVSEFFRDPISNQMLSDTWLGLKQLQWITLGLCLVSLGVFFLLRTKHYSQSSSKQIPDLPISEARTREWIMGIGVTLLFLGSVGILNRAEWLASLPLVLVLLGVVLWKLGKLNLPRVLIALAIPGAMAMATLPDTTAFKLYAVTGMTAGKYSYPTAQGEGCMGTYYTDYVTKDYYHSSVGAKASVENLHGVRTYFDGEFYAFRGVSPRKNGSPNWTVAGISTHFDANIGWIGIGLGGIGGDAPSNSVIPLSQGYGHLQLGNYRNGYVVVGIRDDFASSPYAGIGGAIIDHRLRFGVGITQTGGYSDLSYNWPQSGVTMEFRGIFQPLGEELTAVQEASLRLLFEL